MNATTVGIDLAKDVFELAFSDASGRVIERKRLSRKAFAGVLDQQTQRRVVMEACSSAHYWGRRFVALGHAVRLIPARDVRPYVRRNKTDRTDVAGLLEADRCADIASVPLKTPEQQGVQAMHRVRERLKVSRPLVSGRWCSKFLSMRRNTSFERNLLRRLGMLRQRAGRAVEIAALRDFECNASDRPAETIGGYSNTASIGAMIAPT